MDVHVRVAVPLSSTITCAPTRTQATAPLSALSMVSVAPAWADDTPGAHGETLARAAGGAAAGCDPQAAASPDAPVITAAASIDRQRMRTSSKPVAPKPGHVPGHLIRRAPAPAGSIGEGP